MMRELYHFFYKVKYFNQKKNIKIFKKIIKKGVLLINLLFYVKNIKKII